MPTINEDNVDEYQGYIETLYNGTKSVRDGAFKNCSTLKDNFDSCKPSDWGDDVGKAFQARLDECVSNMDTLHTSANGGSFNQLHSCVFRCKEYADEVVRLKGSKKNYKTSRSNLNKESENYQKSYDYYTRQINECDDYIKGNLEKLNGEVAKLPGFHFELSGNTSNSDAGSDSGADTGSGDDSSSGSQNGRQILDEFLETNDLMYIVDDAMATGHATFEINGEHFVVIYDNAGNYTLCTCEPACHFTDGKIDNAVPIEGATLTSDQFGEQFVHDGEITYDNFEGVIVNYFNNK